MTKDPNIAARFMLAHNFADYTPPPLAISMPKLNGIRAMYVPGRGFWSRDGVQYAETVTAHIKVASSEPIDGEFYVHGWDLQDINAAIGVNLNAPVADTPAVQFHVFDYIVPVMPAVQRMERLPAVVAASANVVAVPWKLATFQQYDKLFPEYINECYEGQMLKQPYSGYFPGRSQRLLKRKDWKFMEIKILELCEGKGEFAGMFGGALVETSQGLRFNVGTGKGLTHLQRIQIWNRPDSLINKWYKIRYLALSTDKKPLNATILL